MADNTTDCGYAYSMSLNQFPVLAFKVARRLRKIGERYMPITFFNYDAMPDNYLKRLSAWPSYAPFSSDFAITDRLAKRECDFLVTLADSFCRHEFDLLGSGVFSFGASINWQLDFSNNCRWSSETLSSLIQTKTGDVKLPWELSRFHHVTTLSLAYLITKNDKYLDELFFQIDDWIDHNPVGYGVNWVCTMDVSIRAVNLLVSSALLHSPLCLPKNKKIAQKLVSSLWKHAHFIVSHLEWLGPKADAGANHLLFDLTGLLSLGSFFKDTIKGDKWFNFALKELEVQMQRQVLSDGVHFERSISYHYFCLEAFLWCGSLVKKQNLPFNKLYYKHLQKMKLFANMAIKPNGSIPLIGDNDDGHLIRTGLEKITHNKWLTNENLEFSIDRFLLDGTINPKSSNNSLSIKSCTFSQGGFHFLKNGSTFVSIRAGSLAYAGTHAHNDQLSFELTLNGIDIFVDRGTFVYKSAPKQRNQYRSTAAHNVLQMNDSEQIGLGSTFYGLPDYTKTLVTKFSRNELKATYKAFPSITRDNLHFSRHFILTDQSLSLFDYISNINTTDSLKWHFHLSPDLNASISGSDILISKNNLMICTLSYIFPGITSIEDFSHSPSYGIKQDAKVIRINYNGDSTNSSLNLQFKINWGGHLT